MSMASSVDVYTFSIETVYPLKSSMSNFVKPIVK